jgi:hypothetical protein
MEKQSLVLPIAVSVLVSLVVFGGLGYYLGSLGALNVGQVPETTYSPAPIVSTAAVSPSAAATTTPTATASASVTASWKTYTSTADGFTFKYPTNFYLKETTNASGRTVTVSTAEIKDDAEPTTDATNPNYSINIEVQAANAVNDTATGRISQYTVGKYTVNDMGRESGDKTLSNKKVVVDSTNHDFVVHSSIPQASSAVTGWKTTFDTLLSTFTIN